MAENMRVTCDQCGEEFHVDLEDEIRDAADDYCSRICRMRAGQ